MKRENIIPVFFACDNAFVKFTVVALHSIMCNANREYRYRIHILHNDITEEMQEKIKAMEDDNFEIRFENVMHYLDKISERLPIRDYYSNTTYYRMFIAEMFPQYDKALYLDCDTLVLGDIADLYAYDLGDNLLGGAPCEGVNSFEVYKEYVRKVDGLNPDYFFNAGVILMNLKAFREEGFYRQFADLLEKIAQIPGDFLIRFMTSHPRDASNKLFDTMAASPKIAKQLHLPFQSGSSRVLKAMNRHYDREKYLELVRYAKSVMPDLVLTSDVIVGFPGETEEEFEETISLIEQVRYDSLFTFIFSPRTGTPAASMDDPTTKEEKNRRFDRLCAVQNSISEKIHESYVGKTLRCLIDGTDKEFLTARTEGGRLVRCLGDAACIGSYQNITITGAATWSLTGILEREEA